MLLQFTHHSLASEFCQLRGRNPPLAVLVDCLGEFVWQSMRKNVVVTNIFRTPQRQATTYGKGTKKVNSHASLHTADWREVHGSPSELEARLPELVQKASPHMFWQAVDIRPWIYTPGEIVAILAFVQQYDAYNQCPVIQAARSRTVWMHEAGTHGPHFHIQYYGPPVRLCTRPAPDLGSLLRGGTIHAL